MQEDTTDSLCCQDKYIHYVYHWKDWSWRLEVRGWASFADVRLKDPK